MNTSQIVTALVAPPLILTGMFFIYGIHVWLLSVPIDWKAYIGIFTRHVLFIDRNSILKPGESNSDVNRAIGYLKYKGLNKNKKLQGKEDKPDILLLSIMQMSVLQEYLRQGMDKWGFLGELLREKHDLLVDEVNGLKLESFKKRRIVEYMNLWERLISSIPELPSKDFSKYFKTSEMRFREHVNSLKDKKGVVTKNSLGALLQKYESKMQFKVNFQNHKLSILQTALDLLGINEPAEKYLAALNYDYKRSRKGVISKLDNLTFDDF